MNRHEERSQRDEQDEDDEAAKDEPADAAWGAEVHRVSRHDAQDAADRVRLGDLHDTATGLDKVKSATTELRRVGLQLDDPPRIESSDSSTPTPGNPGHITEPTELGAVPSLVARPRRPNEPKEALGRRNLVDVRRFCGSCNHLLRPDGNAIRRIREGRRADDLAVPLMDRLSEHADDDDRSQVACTNVVKELA